MPVGKFEVNPRIFCTPSVHTLFSRPDTSGLAKRYPQMNDLPENEKQIALSVIREMTKSRRSMQDIQDAADEVLRVYRKVTAPKTPNRVWRLCQRLLLPFGNN